MAGLPYHEGSSRRRRSQSYQSQSPLQCMHNSITLYSIRAVLFVSCLSVDAWCEAVFRSKGVADKGVQDIMKPSTLSRQSEGLERIVQKDDPKKNTNPDIKDKKLLTLGWHINVTIGANGVSEVCPQDSKKSPSMCGSKMVAEQVRPTATCDDATGGLLLLLRSGGTNGFRCEDLGWGGWMTITKTLKPVIPSTTPPRRSRIRRANHQTTLKSFVRPGRSS